MGEGLRLLLLAAMAALMLAAVWTDLRSRTIPNWLNAAIAGVAVIWWFASGLPLWPDFAVQLGLALAVFALFAVAFAFGAMGGGDVKMAAAVALWLPLTELLQFLVIMALAGGVVTIATMIWHRALKHEGAPEIPYGVAIAFAGLWAVAERYLNHFG